MSTKVQIAKRAFGKSVDDWQWAWCNETAVLQDNRKNIVGAIRRASAGHWLGQVESRPRETSENLFALLERLLSQLDLPWPVLTELRMIAAAEYERLRLLDEEFSKLKERRLDAGVSD